MKWLYRIIATLKCRHKWNIYNHVNVHEDNSGRPVSIRLILRCSKCGDIKTRNV